MRETCWFPHELRFELAHILRQSRLFRRTCLVNIKRHIVLVSERARDQNPAEQRFLTLAAWETPPGSESQDVASGNGSRADHRCILVVGRLRKANWNKLMVQFAHGALGDVFRIGVDGIDFLLGIE